MSGSQELLLGNFVSGGYQISRSLRFNSADSAYLNRTPASAGNRKTWTWSGWVKISSLPANNALFAAYKGSGSVDNEFFALYFSSSGSLRAGGWSTIYFESNAVYRDFSAWYHVVCTIDTTSATSNNRVRLYINGSEITAFYRSNPNQNTDLGVNQNTLHQIGQNGGFGSYFNGYMADINFIDGQALTPSSFGETDADTGVWKPIKYTGTYGTNGFFLQFADNSGTTSTTLGKDTSGNGNNWTPNNFSVTAGAGNDSLLDTPTPYGTDTGAGGEVRGNYCTANPLDIYPKSGTWTVSNGNLDLSLSGAVWDAIRGTTGVTSGKWYWEITATGINNTNSYAMVGIQKGAGGNWQDPFAYVYYSLNGQKYNNGSGAAYGNSWTTNDVIGVAFDADAGEIKFYKNNTVQNSGTAAFTGLTSGPYTPVIMLNGTGSAATVTCNFGQRPFAYTAPSGFKALCTTNLPTPTIGATATTRADDYFNAVLYTGNGSSTQAVTVGFQPDFVWIKSRSVGRSHRLTNAITGVSNATLYSDSTSAQGAGPLASFDSNGFTVNNTDNYNVNAETYVSWNWKGNGAGSSNTQGTITSTVSANTTAGFSIVTYTGTGSNATVGHGLGATPGMIIIKSRNNTYNWAVWHTSLGGGDYALQLNTTSARTNAFDYWNGDPSSTLFTLGTDNGVNQSTTTYVAYCFAPVAGYSAFGSYTGNGSADGPFIYTNFRPEYVLIKPSSAVDAWQVEDAARSPFNTVNDQLFPNTSDAEQVDSATRNTDFLSNGFKIRGTNTGVNGNGTTYIYAAFAEFPFKYTLAR